MSARGLVTKPTTRQEMVHIRVFLYQGYDIHFYCGEAHCRLQAWLAEFGQTLFTWGEILPPIITIDTLDSGVDCY